MVKKKVRNLCLRCWSLTTQKYGCKDMSHPRVHLKKFIDKITSAATDRLEELKDPEHKPTDREQQEIRLYTDLLSMLQQQQEKLGKDTIPFILENAMNLFGLVNLYDRKGKMGIVNKHFRQDDWLATFSKNVAPKGGDVQQKPVPVPVKPEFPPLSVKAEPGQPQPVQQPVPAPPQPEKMVMPPPQPASSVQFPRAQPLPEDTEIPPSKYILLTTSEFFSKSSITLVDAQRKTSVAFFLLNGPKQLASSIQVGYKLFFTGGVVTKSRKETAECSFFDFTSNTSQVKPFASMNVPRLGHSMVEVGGALYCIGGEVAAEIPTRYEKCYPNLKKWTMGPALPRKIQSRLTFPMDDHWVYVLDNERYEMWRLDAFEEEAGWVKVPCDIAKYRATIGSNVAVQTTPTEVHFLLDADNLSAWKYDKRRKKMASVAQLEVDRPVTGPESDVLRDGTSLIWAQLKDFIQISRYHCDVRKAKSEDVKTVMQYKYD